MYPMFLINFTYFSEPDLILPLYAKETRRLVPPLLLLRLKGNIYQKIVNKQLTSFSYLFASNKYLKRKKPRPDCIILMLAYSSSYS